MQAKAMETSPVKTVIEELDKLRADFRASLDTYAARIEEEIAQVQSATEPYSKKKKIPEAKLRDLREMLTLLRKFSIKPEKGRRKDLKKIDALVGDLTMLIETW